MWFGNTPARVAANHSWFMPRPNFKGFASDRLEVTHLHHGRWRGKLPKLGAWISGWVHQNSFRGDPLPYLQSRVTGLDESSRSRLGYEMS